LQERSDHQSGRMGDIYGSRPPKRQIDGDEDSAYKRQPAMSTHSSVKRQTEFHAHSEVFEMHQQILHWVDKYERAAQAATAAEARAKFLENLIGQNPMISNERVNQLEQRVIYLTNELENERLQSKKRIDELTHTVVQNERFMQQSQQNSADKGANSGPRLNQEHDSDIIAVDESSSSSEAALRKKVHDLESKYQMAVREMEEARLKSKFLENLIETSSVHSDRISAAVSADGSQNKDVVKFSSFHTIVHEKYNNEYRKLGQSMDQGISNAGKRMREEEPAAYADAKECAKAWTAFYNKNRAQIPPEYVASNREAFVKRWTSKRNADDVVELSDG
ncbi:hypothetical protein PMAYCL1PPCAC_13204, partial [Pristionchus mayeri]